jgi:hypothetical protein
VIKLHKDAGDPTDSFTHHELIIMKGRIDLDMEKRISTWQALRIPSVKRRFMLGFLAMMGTQCSGLIVLLSMSQARSNQTDR